MKHLEWERNWELKQQAQRIREIEKYKGKLVIDHMKQWKTACELSAFLDELQIKASGTPGLDDYVAWAREYVRAINPISWPEELVFDESKLERHYVAVAQRAFKRTTGQPV